jgi:trans-aconitate methyltransferase
LYSALSDLLPKKSRYTGIDFAAGMIDQAKKAAPKATRLVDDMVGWLANQPQESIDLLFGIASIQHIKGKQQRALFFADAYRALTR